MNRRRETGLPDPFRETKFSGANADREIFIFLVQLMTSRISNLIRLIHTLAICVTIHAHQSTSAQNTSSEHKGAHEHKKA